MRTLVYFASGSYYERYEALSFDQIILIDKSAFLDYEHTLKDSKVKCWSMSALEALDEFKNRGIQIDALVILNEGLEEGGAEYPLLTNLFLGLVYPFLKKTFLFITDFEHYRKLNMPKSMFELDAGFATKVKVIPADSFCPDPSVFMNTYNPKGISTNPGHVYRITKSKQVAEKQFGNITLRLVHGSIWSNEEQYKAIGLALNSDQKYKSYSSNFVIDYIYQKSIVFFNDFKNLTDLCDYCNDKKIDKLALGPWLNHDYEHFLRGLINNNHQTPLTIAIYHQNRNDLRELYLSCGAYFLQTFPFFISNLKKDAANWSYFEDALNKGVGKYIFAICEAIVRYNEINPNEPKTYFRQIKVKFSDLKIHLSTNNDYYKGATETARNMAYYELNKTKNESRK